MPEKSVANGDMADAVMTLQEIAAYLKVSEKTILRMVQAGELPGLKVSNQWRFVRAAIDDWLTSQMHRAASENLAEVIQPALPLLALPRLLTPDRILMELKPGDKKRVLKQLMAPLEADGTVLDSQRYLTALLEREQMVSTGIGDGVAIPHTRMPEASVLRENCVVLGLCRDGMPFDALDDMPTRLFLLIGATCTETHLRLTARTMLLLRRPGFIDGLFAAANRNAVRALIVDAQGATA